MTHATGPLPCPWPHTAPPLAPYSKPQQLSYTSGMLQGLAVHPAPSRVTQLPPGPWPVCQGIQGLSGHFNNSQRSPPKPPYSKGNSSPFPFCFLHSVTTSDVTLFTYMIVHLMTLCTPPTLFQWVWWTFLQWQKCSLPVLIDTMTISLWALEMCTCAWITEFSIWFCFNEFIFKFHGYCIGQSGSRV